MAPDLPQRLTFWCLALLMAGPVLAQEADLYVTKTADRESVRLNEFIEWTIVAGNNGPSTLPEVIVEDSLPGWVTVTEMDEQCQFHPVWSYLVECSFPLSPSETKTIHITARVDEPPVPNAGIWLTDHLSPSHLAALTRTSPFTVENPIVSEADNLSVPGGVFAQADGFLLVAEQRNTSLFGPDPITDGAIIRIDPVTGVQVVVSENGLLVNPSDVILAPDGMIYVADLNGFRFDMGGAPTGTTFGRIIRIDPVSGLQMVLAEDAFLETPTGLIWHNGQIIVIDQSRRLIAIDPVSGIQFLKSENGLFDTPHALTAYDGNYMIADLFAGIIRVDAVTGVQVTLAPTLGNGGEILTPYDLDLHTDQVLYVLDYEVGDIWLLDPITGLSLASFHVENAGLLNGLDVVELPPEIVNFVSINQPIGEGYDPDTTNNMTTARTPFIPDSPAVEVWVLENIFVMDSVNVGAHPTIRVIETINVVDSVSVQPPVDLLVSEMIVVNDQSFLILPLELTIVEQLQVQDAVTVTPPYMLTVSENISVIDGVNTVLPLMVVVNESISVNDAITTNPSTLILVSEVINTRDEVGVLVPLAINVTETITASDSITTTPSTLILVSEVITANDDIGVLVPLAINVSENITATDSITTTPSTLILVREVITANDDVGVLVPLAINVTETITASDSVTTQPSIIITVVESIVANDAVTTVPSTSILVTELISTHDDVNVSPRLVILITETIRTNDSVATSIAGVPQIAFARAIAGRCEPEILPGIKLEPSVTELEIAFSELMNATASESSGAGNIANFRLVRSQNASVVLPLNCSDPLPAGAQEQALVMVDYLTEYQATVLRSPLATGLEQAHYQLLACSGGLRSIGGVDLDGDADNEAGGDYAIAFSISASNLLANPNFSDSADHWALAGGAIFSEEDADLAIRAGSVLLNAEPVFSSVGQCVDLSTAGGLRLAGSFMGTADNSEVQLGIDYFEGTGCTGGLLKSDVSQHVPKVESWNDGYLKSSTTTAAQSAWVSFETQDDTHPIFLDRVYLIVLPDLIFGSGFERSVAGPECIDLSVP